MSKVRIALVGCGGISRSHAAAYQALSGQAEVVYCVDPIAANAAERAAALAAEPRATLDGLLDEVDAVDICTPHHLHHAAARQALEAGKHVLCEKPLANHPDECSALAALARERDRRLMVGYVLRYNPAMARMQEVLAAGTYGDLIQLASSVEAHVTGEHLAWAAKRDQLGGGVMFSHGCHTIDLMLWMAGPVRRVAMLGNNVGAEWMEGEGSAQLILEFAGGALGHHCSSWAMPHKHAIPTLRAWCREGYLEVVGNRLLACVGRESQVLYEPAAGEPPAMTRQIECFLTCCRTGREPLTGAQAALDSLAVIWAGYESRETGRMVDLREPRSG